MSSRPSTILPMRNTDNAVEEHVRDAAIETIAGERGRAWTVHDLESIAKGSAGIGAFCYAVGFISTNIYLLRLGISDFSIVKPQSILTGLLIVVLLVILGLLSGNPCDAVHETKNSVESARKDWGCSCPYCYVRMSGGSWSELSKPA